MLPKRKRHLLYAALLPVLAIVCTSAIANARGYNLIVEVTSVLKSKVTPISTSEGDKAKIITVENTSALHRTAGNSIASAPMFSTIIQGADDVVNCTNNGFTIARFVLCGDSDDRTISLSGGPFGSVSWQQLTGAAPNTNLECPNTNGGAYTEVAVTQDFNLDASSISASTGAEFRVQVDGTGPFYYFEVVKSTINQTYTKKNFVCNNPGRIELTGLPNSYQFRIREGSGAFGPYQSSSIFSNLQPGFYTVQTKLDVDGQVCEYLYDVIEIEQVDIEIDVTFTDPVCSGETGSIDVAINSEVPGPYVYTLLDENGAEIAFTSTISSNTYRFDDVSEGVYAIKVETNDCKEDIPNGIAAPIQYTDTSGNPIEVGTGLSPITVTSDTNGMSFGCATISSVDIDITPVGGSGTYSYTVSDGGNSGGTFTGTSSYTVNSPGTYTFFITDSQGCTAEKSEYVAELSPPDIDVNTVVGTCINGGGKVEFVVNDAMGFNLEFRATNNPTGDWTASSTIPLPDDTYNNVEIRYSQGAFSCVLSKPAVTVTSSGGLTGSATLTQDYTCANGEGIIDFSPASGGSGSGYEYSIDNVTYQSGTQFTGLVPGTTYTPYIKDDAGCYEALAPITVSEPIPPTAVNFSQDDLNCATGTSRVTIDVQPGSFVVTQYEIIAASPATALPPAQASNVFSGLQLDTSYQFEITDANGCVYPASFTTGGFSTIRARVKSGGDRKVCPTATDGTGAFLVDGFATDYDYTINRTAPLPTTLVTNGTTSDSEIPITGLGAGTYEITVTDNETNCTSTASFDVEEAATALGVSSSVTDMSCQNGNIGRVRATANGGFPGYRYQLEWPAASGVPTQGPKTGRTFGNLTAEGEYILTVIDSEGCTAETRFTLTSVDAPSITFDSADYCYSPTNDAEITVSSTAGTATLATHQYRINGGALQTPGTAGTFTFDNLVPGDYTIEVVDGNGCIDQTSVIRIPPQVQVSLDIAGEIPCGGDGQMEITVNGGDISSLPATSYTIEYRDTAPNPFAVVAGHSGNPLPSGSFSYTVPYGSPGDYRVSVSDSNGCTMTSEVLTFAEPTNIIATERVVGPSCGDLNSGFVEIIPTVSSGIPPFEVVFAPAGTLVADPNNPDPTLTYSFSSQTIYSGLAAGSYEYLVKDARNCITALTTVNVVDDPNAAPDATATPIDANCTSGDLAGGVTVNLATAGSPDYTVIVEDVFGNPIVTQNNVAPGDFPLALTDPSLIPGNYQVIVLDARGCSDIEPVTINSIDLDIVPDFTALPPVCTSGGFTVCVDIANGVGPFLVRVNEDPSSAWDTLADQPSSPPRRHCLGSVQFGVSYNVEVLDTNTGCSYSEVITIPDAPGSSLNVDLDIDNANCYNGDVGLEYTIASGTGPYNVVITNLDTGAEELNLAATSITNNIIPVPAGHYGISVEDIGTNCSDGDETEAILNTPRVDIVSNENANCNALGQLTVRGSGGTPYAVGSPYLYAYVPAGTPVDDDGTLTPGDPSDDFSESSTVALPGALAPGIEYDIWVKDANDCAYRISAAVIQMNPDLPAPDIDVNNQCSPTPPVGGFTVVVSMPGDIDTPTFTFNGVSQTPVYTPGTTTQATFNVGSAGSYPIHVIDANGCDVDDVVEVFQVLTASGNFTTEPNCEEPDGIVTITSNGGSGDFSYVLSGNDFLGNPVNVSLPNEGATVNFPNIPPGDYQVDVTDNVARAGGVFCDFTVDNIVRTAPITPVISDAGKSDVSCNGANDGSISVSLQGGTDTDGIKEYNLYSGNLASMPSAYDVSGRINTNASGSFTGLTPGTYVVEVVTDRNCFDREEVVIDEPDIFTVTAVAGTLQCEVGANRYSTTTITATVNDVGNGGPYGFKINAADSYQTTNTTTMDFEIVDNGAQQSFYVYAIDSKGCEFVIPNPIVIDPPNAVTGLISQVSPMDCENPERIRIDVTGTTNFIIEDQGNSIAPVPSQTVNGNTFVEFALPMAVGEYRLQINDVGGCTYPLESYTVIEPLLPTVSISQNDPVSCLSDTDGVLNIEVTNLGSLTNFSGTYDYWVYDASDPGFSGGAFGSPVAGNSTGTIDVIADGNPTTITGLPGGNLRVVIREQGKTVNACNVFSNVSAILTPSEQLRITTLEEIGRVGCSDDFGEIVATTVGGWDGSTYEYMLEYESSVGSGFTPHATYGSFATNGDNNRFTGLSRGNYRVTVRDVEGCTHFEELELLAVPLIQAEAIETRQLECPTGADAVIVAVEPGTTTPGAIGGVPGGGYQYRLIKLDPNNPDPTDPANHISSTGLQSEPEFVGSSGTGVISGGWYSIEVVSTLNCQAFTAPVNVVPPPPINPALIQTSVPACGNIATMMIRVNNAQAGTYEYSVIGTGIWNPIDEVDANGLPVKTGIPGTIGSAYRYEVRKVGGLSSCLARKTNGITITDAEPLSLDPTSPTFDVSCAYEIDGRIEAIAKGGTGIYEFRIYDTDPGSDAFAASLLPTYQSRAVQDYGTFENLDAGSYWISVISRQNCGVVEGPFTIAPAEPVTVEANSTNVSCNGDTDGTITMTVTSPGAGLVQFAIEPNFSEFFTDPDNPTEFTFTDLPAKPVGEFYTVLAQDAEGCPQFFEVPVHEPDELLVANVQTTPELCIGAHDGTVVFDIQGGTPFNDPAVSPTPYFEYKIEMLSPNNETGTGVFAPYDGQTIQNLQGGASYALYVQDVNMCSTTEVFSIDIGVNLTAEPVVQYGCEGIFPNSTASVELQDDGVLPRLLFSLDVDDLSVADTQRTWGDLPAGNHTVYIYHENGCVNQVEFEIEGYDPLTLTAVKTGPNEVTATAVGGFGGYEFFFQGQSTGSENVFTTNESTTVNIEVRDQNGCVAMVTMPFEFTGMLEIPNFFTPDGDNMNDVWAPNNMDFFPDIEVKIYDRYGRVVAVLDNVSKWDGTYDGNEVPTGDYWYVVNANDKDKQRYVGHFTLYR